MSEFICPVCKEKLNIDNRAYVCPNNHSFDISKYGYINLLMSQQSSDKRHGDDKLMVRARRDFLTLGYYEPLCRRLCQLITDHVPSGSMIADIGCGEGYYTGAVMDSGDYRIYGIDISKDALRYAAKALKDGEFAVASAFSLPFGDESADCVLNIFAPSAYEEFYRVLKSDGILVKAVPMEDHLWGLKCALYKEPYKNKPEKRNDELFELVSENEIRYDIELDDSEKIGNLFKMTPYFYKTGREESERLLSMPSLKTTVHFNVEIYKKR